MGLHLLVLKTGRGGSGGLFLLGVPGPVAWGVSLSSLHWQSQEGLAMATCVQIAAAQASLHP